MTISSALHEKIHRRLRAIDSGCDLHHLPEPLLEALLVEAKQQIATHLAKAEERAIRSVVTKKLVVRVIRDRLLQAETSRERSEKP